MAKFVPFIIKTDGSQNISVKIVRMKKSDAVQTEKEPVWQTSWLSDYIQDDAFEKYALKTSNGELVALAAHYVRDYGACPLPSFGGAPRYELSGEATMNIFVTYLK